MGVLMRKWLCVFMMSILAASTTSFASSSPELKTFLHDLNSQCPLSIPCCSYPIEADGESFERALTSCKKNDLFSRYGIHSAPSLLMFNQKTQMRYHGPKDLQSLVNFYKRTTGLDPVVDMVEDTSSNPNNHQNVFKLSDGAALKETFLREPYLLPSMVFVLARAFPYFFPEIAASIIALWVACTPHLNFGTLGDSRQLIDRVLHLVDVKRIWSKLKLCKTRNIHTGARNARVWVSSLASVSLGKTSSSRVFPSRDL